MKIRASRNLGWALAAVWLLGVPGMGVAQNSSWVKTGVTGRLIYVPDAEGDRIPDFSMVGYGAGKQSIPDNLPVVTHIDPIAGDNTQHIQNAINFAATRPIQANGFRGVVELGPGKFDVHGHLSITASGVVLRGSGGGDDFATNTHIVSQNRTDSMSSASTPVINIQGSSSGITRGPQIQILDKRVPVGAQSFRVASTAGMTVGGMVEIFRPSTQAWIEELGMHLIPDGKEWSAGDRELEWQRTITRIEGNRIFFDAPITTALDANWGGGTVRTYNAPNVIRNIGVENLRGQSLDAREELNELRTPSFVRFTRIEDGFVRDVETRHFPYASVFTSEADGTQHITVDNVNSLLPSGVVTGGRRYTFAMDGQMSLVKNSHAEVGRHDFVTGSDVTGPIVFYNSTTSGTRGDSGPHHRWGNGLLFDNIDVNGNAINVQNRWTSGSGHGWAGANVVVWNSEANSFIVQSPPTAQSWLIGSTGTINAGNCHLGTGVSCAGFVESHGMQVTVGGEQSLYEAQVNDAADIREFHWTGGNGNWSDAPKWDQEVTPGVYSISMREYVHGDMDDFTLDFEGRDSLDEMSASPDWRAAIQQESALPFALFDQTVGDRNAALTLQHQLDASEQVVHGYLALALKQSGDSVSDDFLQLFDTSPENTQSFSSLGWASQINATTPFVGVVDMGQYLNHAQVQSGSVNVRVSDDTTLDWAIYTVAVATPRTDPVGATVFLEDGNVLVNSVVSPVAMLQNGGRGANELTIGSGGRLTVNDDFVQSATSTLAVQLDGTASDQFGRLVVGDVAVLAGTLQIELTGGFLPSGGNEFEILTATGGFAGTAFTNVLLPSLGGNLTWQVDHDADSVIARVLGTTVAGDLTGDGFVTGADWTAFKAGQGTDFTGLSSLEAYALGDLDGDFDHDLGDFAVFRTAFINANGAGAFSALLAGVPEPASAGLALLAIALSISVRRAH